MADAPRAGRPFKLKKSDVTATRRHLRSQATNTIRTATQSVNRGKQQEDSVCERTVRRAVTRQLAGVLSYGPVQHGKISKPNVAKRKHATRPAAVKSTEQQLHKLYFLDAAILRFKPKQAIKAFRVPKGWNDKAHPKPPALQGWKLMQYYAAVAVDKEGQVHKHEIVPIPEFSPTSKFYIASVGKRMLEWAQERLGSDCRAVQDNARAHTAKASEQWRQQAGCLLHAHPPQSPGMNRIECVWVPHKHGCATRKPKTEAGFWKAVQEEWDKVPDSFIKARIEELPEVMTQIHKAPRVHVNKMK